MGLHVPRARVIRHELPEGSWELVTGTPDPRLRDYGTEECVGELRILDSSDNSVAIINPDGTNLLYSPNRGETPVSTAAVGGVELTRGAYRAVLRTSCSAHRHEDITRSNWADTQIAVYVRGPSDNSLRPGSTTDFVFRQTSK